MSGARYRTPNYPHYMEGTKVSRMREEYNREKYMKSFSRSPNYERDLGIRAFKNFRNKLKREEKRENKLADLIDLDLENLPAADDYMREVQYVLNNRTDDDSSHLITDSDHKQRETRLDCFVDQTKPKPGKGRLFQKDRKYLDDRKLFSDHELQLPVIRSMRDGLNGGSIRKRGGKTSDIESFKRDHRPKCSTKLKTHPKSIGDNGHYHHQQHENSSTPSTITTNSSGRSPIVLIENEINQPMLQSKQDQLSKTSSLYNLLDNRSAFSFKFPAISKPVPDSKVHHVIKVPDILCNLPPAKNFREDGNDVNLDRCLSSTRSVGSASLGVSDKKEIVKMEKSKRSFDEDKIITDDSIYNDQSMELNKQATGRNVNRQTQKRFYGDHTFSSLQKIPLKNGDFKTLTSKRFSFQERNHQPTRESSNLENRNQNLFRYLKQLQPRSMQQPQQRHHQLIHQHHHHHHQQPQLDQHSVDNKLNSMMKLNSQSCLSLVEQTFEDDEAWKRERIREWVSRVNLVAQYPPVTGEIRDDTPQTAFHVIHQGGDDDDDGGFLDLFC